MFDRYFAERQETIDQVRSLLREPFEKMTDAVVSALSRKKKIFFFGNGGSAADAQHLATELIDRLQLQRDPIPALALTTNTSLITAVSNDKEFLHIFSRQVEAYAGKGDILLGISTSGGSENVLQAFRQGRGIGTVNVGFTGRNGWKQKDLIDYSIEIPSTDTQLIQEMHIALGHLLCFIVEEELFHV